MRSNRWHEIDRLLKAALELGANRRVAFLREACGADEELRREVEALLAASARTDDFAAPTAIDPMTTRIVPDGHEPTATETAAVEPTPSPTETSQD